MRTFVLFAMAVMMAEVYSTHYRGGTFYWERLGNSKIRVYWRLAFQLDKDWPEYYCNYVGQHMKMFEGYMALTCIDCASNKTILEPLKPLKCASISTEMGWSLFVGHVDYKADRQAFTMGYMTTGRCSASSWIPLQNYGSGKCWSLLTKVDTSKSNDSPSVKSVLPVFQVRHGCRRLIDLNPIDKNGDPTKCRWTNEHECPEGRDSSDTKRVCGQATTLTKLHEEECKIEFITGDDDLEGWYAASVMIEDFPDTKYKKAKSTVPFQFLLQVTPPGSCVGPLIDVANCTVIALGETWISYVTATIGEGSDASIITEIQGSYPTGMDFEYVPGFGKGKKLVKAKLTFTPTSEDKYTYSFTATDNNGVQSDAASGKLIVQSEGFGTAEPLVPPTVLADLSTPAVNSVYEGTNELWTIKFDSTVTRPKENAFIKIYEKGTMGEAIEFNVADSNVVTYPESDPTILNYHAPTGLEGGKDYLIEYDQGIAVKIFTTLCDDNVPAPSPGGVYQFTTRYLLGGRLRGERSEENILRDLRKLRQRAKPPELEVECGDSYIKVRIPKADVGNIPATDLHLHDTRCKIKESDETYYQIEFGYDECGTIIKRKSETKTKFYNTIRDDPKPISEGAPVTRVKHKVELQIICEMEGLGVSDVFFKPAAAVEPKKHKSSGKFKTYLKMYEDSTYNVAVSGTAEVELKETLYFAAQSTTSKDVAIESCRAMAKFGTCTENDRKYTIIENGCSVDSTVKFISSGLDHRFSVKSFGFLQYGLTNEVFLKCRMVSCKPGTSSRCSDIKNGNCSARRRRSTFEDETDTFMTFKMF